MCYSLLGLSPWKHQSTVTMVRSWSTLEVPLHPHPCDGCQLLSLSQPLLLWVWGPWARSRLGVFCDTWTVLRPHQKLYLRGRCKCTLQSRCALLIIIVFQISTCIAFAILLQKDTWVTTGLYSLGTGVCTCARHESVQLLGVANLQKGEQ